MSPPGFTLRGAKGSSLGPAGRLQNPGLASSLHLGRYFLLRGLEKAWKGKSRTNHKASPRLQGCHPDTRPGSLLPGRVCAAHGLSTHPDAAQPSGDVISCTTGTAELSPSAGGKCYVAG